MGRQAFVREEGVQVADLDEAGLACSGPSREEDGRGGSDGGGCLRRERGTGADCGRGGEGGEVFDQVEDEYEEARV